MIRIRTKFYKSWLLRRNTRYFIKKQDQIFIDNNYFPDREFDEKNRCLIYDNILHYKIGKPIVFFLGFINTWILLSEIQKALIVQTALGFCSINYFFIYLLYRSIHKNILRAYIHRNGEDIFFQKVDNYLEDSFIKVNASELTGLIQRLKYLRNYKTCTLYDGRQFFYKRDGIKDFHLFNHVIRGKIAFFNEKEMKSKLRSRKNSKNNKKFK